MSYSIKERITHIVERWWLTEPAFFAVYCSHSLTENGQMKCTMRTGDRCIEYNPALAEMLSDEALEEYLKVECIHILLKHPYERQPEGCHPQAIALASNFVVDQNYRISHLECPKAHEFQLPNGESFEWYALKLNTLIGTAADYGGWADYAGLWEEDILAQEETNELIRKLEASQSWGTIPGHLAEMVLATLKVKLNYKAILRSFHTSILCSRRRLTRMRPNRRNGFQQMGSRYELASSILVCVDVSGSVSSYALSTFYSAIARFFKYGVETVDVLPFDAELKELTTLKKAPKEVMIEGRGGTNFQILFDYIAKHPRYDGMIIFTDGYAPEPKVPQHTHAKVLWVCDCEQNHEQHREWMRQSGKAAFIAL